MREATGPVADALGGGRGVGSKLLGAALRVRNVLKPMHLRPLAFACALAAGLLAPAASAQALTLTTEAPALHPVQINLDHGTFALDAATSLVEVYLALEARTLPFVAAAAGGFEARLPVDFAFVPVTDGGGAEPAAVWTDSTTLRFAVADTAALTDGRQFIHVVRAAVPPGEYELRVALPRAGATPELALRREVRVPDYAVAGRIGLSDLTLATQITRGGDASDPFFRNGVTIRPNATQVFGQTLSQLFYYAEVYGATAAVARGDSAYTLYAYVSEANRPQPFAGLERRVRRPAREVDAVVNGFDLRRVPSGTYSLHLVVLGENNEALAEGSRRFYVYNPNVQATAGVVADVDFETSPYAGLPQGEIDRSLAHLDLIASERDRRRVRDLKEGGADADAKLDEQRRFLWEFWRVRDPNPTTAVNEFREEFYRRLQYADDRYSRAGKEGWRSDRGRVIVKYGIPTNVEPHLYDRGYKPYEIWNYNNIPGEGQAMFVFADRNGYGEFELLSSTVPGERSLPDWDRAIRSN